MQFDKIVLEKHFHFLSVWSIKYTQVLLGVSWVFGICDAPITDSTHPEHHKVMKDK